MMLERTKTFNTLSFFIIFTTFSQTNKSTFFKNDKNERVFCGLLLLYSNIGE